ncbi:ABC transporter permease [Amycolatopsis alkalitolerans]|uniref:ABC transporter permease n=1 Tax=Amycolatopsis alkalitolerans TaxID=2547244 RepID=A0A5C4M491_9PSEU|nr:ABC transporter permease [Amycolatopsis alkalitolerans]TNC26394.1 ABC transporter permease [Amycolatopsis alkalitolerans]
MADGVIAPRAGGPDPHGVIGALVRLPLLRVIARRVLIAVPLLLIISMLSFVLVSLIPGDAARAILGTQGTEEQYQALRHSLGLDLPLYQQYWQWLTHAVHGDLGSSLFSGQTVSEAISQRLPVTLSLMFGVLLVSLLVGVSLGVFSAVRGGVLGRTVDALGLVGFALPNFWVGAMLIVVFAVALRWLPATGYVPFFQSPSQWLQSLILPVFALALHGITAVAKQTREAMLDVLSSDYIRMARANGVHYRSIVSVNAMKNGSIRVVTILGLQAVGLLGGTVVVENVFALPGLGGLAVDSTAQHDLPVIQGIVIYFTGIVVVINLIVDIAYTWLNPKVRTS